VKSILKKLRGGGRRSIGRANEVVADVQRDPALFEAVFTGMCSDDPIIRMRAADAVEKITAEHPKYLQPYKNMLIQQIAKIDQQEIRWHMAQMIPRLGLSKREIATVVEILLVYLNDIRLSSLLRKAAFSMKKINFKEVTCHARAGGHP
jgi:hypothetical protein